MATQVAQLRSHRRVATIRKEGQEKENCRSDIGPSDDAGHGLGVDWVSGEQAAGNGRGQSSSRG